MLQNMRYTKALIPKNYLYFKMAKMTDMVEQDETYFSKFKVIADSKN